MQQFRAWRSRLAMGIPPPPLSHTRYLSNSIGLRRRTHWAPYTRR